jgi:hypothetical protein
MDVLVQLERINMVRVKKDVLKAITSVAKTIDVTTVGW